MHIKFSTQLQVRLINYIGMSLTALPICCSFTMELLDLLVHWSDLEYLLVLDYCFCSDWIRMCSLKYFHFLISVGLITLLLIKLTAS